MEISGLHSRGSSPLFGNVILPKFQLNFYLQTLYLNWNNGIYIDRLFQYQSFFIFSRYNTLYSKLLSWFNLLRKIFPGLNFMLILDGITHFSPVFGLCTLRSTRLYVPSVFLWCLKTIHRNDIFSYQNPYPGLMRNIKKARIQLHSYIRTKQITNSYLNKLYITHITYCELE